MGFGLGYPAIVLDEAGPRYAWTSSQAPHLDNHWERLDAFKARVPARPEPTLRLHRAWLSQGHWIVAGPNGITGCADQGWGSALHAWAGGVPMKKTLALVAGSLIALSACGGTSSVSAEDVAAQISTQLEAQVGTAPDSVTCPSDLPGRGVGATVTCELTADGQTPPVTATVTSVEGSTVNSDIQVADS